MANHVRIATIIIVIVKKIVFRGFYRLQPFIPSLLQNASEQRCW